MALVRTGLGFLLAEHDFRVVGDAEKLVRLQSPTLAVEVVRDRRQVSVNVFRLEGGSALEGCVSTGMVGKASEFRLLEIAADRIKDEPSILGADPAFFEAVAAGVSRDVVGLPHAHASAGP